MRIIAGAQRGLQLAEVGQGDAAAHLRPTSDRVREAIFNVLTGGRFGDPVGGAQVLDLFAGTGALGLEALSRGAVQATFVDDGRVAQGLIRANIARARRQGEAVLLTVNATRLPANTGPAAGLLFLDPPYGKGLGLPALLSAQAGGWVAPGAVVVWEEAAPMPAPPGFTAADSRRYGDTHVTLLRAA
ncbi:MAG: 16S rRNA (guanine(966)-N(2))-methyltransferase RsmD [Rhodobacterales bacterium]|nr:16S rRNA (guanine(966)-N(2))-methyltransferase RsmD [Rhodobacterales bacterium]NCT11285.1 16S rRNA (guanine(966)-N(2))-methyltransferase RsmD [Rhodobacterales bacterium]